MKTQQPTLELDQSAPPTGLAKQDGDKQVSIIQIIDKLTGTPNLTMETIGILERLVALQERREAQERKERFETALAECQQLMPRIEKNGMIDMGQKGKIPYSRLEDLDACIRPVYAKYGFSIRYDAPVSVDGGKIRLTARFSCYGHTEHLEITLPPDQGPGRSPVQAVKSSITAGRRHLTEMFFNIIEEGSDEKGYMKTAAKVTQKQADDLRCVLQEIEPTQEGLGRLLAKVYRIYKITGLEEMLAVDLPDALQRAEALRKAK